MSEREDIDYDDEEQAWNEAWSDDESDDGALSQDPPAADEPDPESPPDPAPSQQQEPAPDDDIESLKQKLRSAEGRFNKFEQHIDTLKDQISKLETPDELETPEQDTFLPDGWSKEDWDDFSADYPVQAELLEGQSRQVQKLSERVDNTEQHLSVTEQNRVFNDTIHQAHPDYDDLLQNERQQIIDFIAGQKNPTLKTAYEQIYQGGTAEQIVELVNDYKATGRTSGSDKTPPVNSNIDNALAVPGRSRSPSKISGRAGIPDEDDFDGSWDYFSDDSIED